MWAWPAAQRPPSFTKKRGVFAMAAKNSVLKKSGPGTGLLSRGGRQRGGAGQQRSARKRVRRRALSGWPWAQVFSHRDRNLAPHPPSPKGDPPPPPLLATHGRPPQGRAHLDIAIMGGMGLFSCFLEGVAGTHPRNRAPLEPAHPAGRSRQAEQKGATGGPSKGGARTLTAMWSLLGAGGSSRT